MDLNKFTLDVCQKIRMFKFIYQKEEFLARELFDELDIPPASGYRNLEIWRNKGLLKKPENGDGTNYNVKYKTTLNWTKFYEGFRKTVLDILLYEYQKKNSSRSLSY